MKDDHLHPADRILLMMNRIYKYGMTTMSGGNLSIREAGGDIWITPSGVDKGALRREDIVCIKADGRIIGRRSPSSEWPFHRRVYETRADVNAVVHAHPPALVSFSMARRTPNVKLLPDESRICGEVGLAAYALPGSEELGRKITEVLAKGANSVILENHGVVTVGPDLFAAFNAFEALEYCARLEIAARRLGTPLVLDDAAIALARDDREAPPAGGGGGAEAARAGSGFAGNGLSGMEDEERKRRREMCGIVRRAYDQQLFTSTQGTISVRLGDDRFLITPFGKDRMLLEPDDLVAVAGGVPEAGKRPSRSWPLHRAIYARQPRVNAVMLAHPPHVTAFAVTEAAFDSRTIPESYILLRDAPKLPYAAAYLQPEETAGVFSPSAPLALVRNNGVIVTGGSLLEAYDRLEVAEFSAKAMIDARTVGPIVQIGSQDILDLHKAFQLAD